MANKPSRIGQQDSVVWFNVPIGVCYFKQATYSDCCISKCWAIDFGFYKFVVCFVPVNTHRYGFLTNTLTPAQVLQAMAQLFVLAPGDVRWGLMNLQGREPALMARLFTGG